MPPSRLTGLNVLDRPRRARVVIITLLGVSVAVACWVLLAAPAPSTPRTDLAEATDAAPGELRGAPRVTPGAVVDPRSSALPGLTGVRGRVDGTACAQEFIAVLVCPFAADAGEPPAPQVDDQPGSGSQLFDSTAGCVYAVDESDGGFQLELGFHRELAPGGYALEAFDGHCATLVRRFEVQPGAMTELGTLALERGLTIVGTVSPSEGARVEVVEPWYTLTASPLPDGTFQLEGLRPGAHVLRASGPAGAFDGWVEAGARVQLRLVPQRFTGIVRLASGRPAVGVEVTAEPDEWADFFKARSDARGAFEVAVPTSGVYWLAFEGESGHREVHARPGDSPLEVELVEGVPFEVQVLDTPVLRPDESFGAPHDILVSADLHSTFATRWQDWNGFAIGQRHRFLHWPGTETRLSVPEDVKVMMTPILPGVSLVQRPSAIFRRTSSPR